MTEKINNKEPENIIKDYGGEIFDNFPDALVIYDGEGIITFANKSLADFLHFQPAELAGRPLIGLIPESEQDRFGGILEKIIIDGRYIRDISTVIIDKNNKEISVSFTGFSLKSMTGRIAGGVGILVDVRQLQGLLEALRQAKAELEQRVKDRTKEIQEKVDELEKFYKLSVGRELKMAELKSEIKKLKKAGDS